MTESKVYELFTELMSECWEWAYDHPDRAVAYYDGAYTMAQKVIEALDLPDEISFTPDGIMYKKNCVKPCTDAFNPLGKEVST